MIRTWLFFPLLDEKKSVVREIAELICNKKYEVRKWEEDPCEPCSLLQM